MGSSSLSQPDQRRQLPDPAYFTAPPDHAQPCPYPSAYANPPEQPPPPPHPSYVTCLWGTCQANFSSLPELITHVNQHHLRTSTTTPSPSDALECLWRDCAVFPSIEAQEADALTSHLLQDHLGMGVKPPKHAHTTSPPPPPPPLPLPPAPPPPHHHLPVHAAATVTSPHTCDGAHPCRWAGCTQTFPECTALTAHLTEAHVGAGRARYECFWEGCARNGEEGFASKQKICRHLQVLFIFIFIFIGGVVDGWLCRVIRGTDRSGVRSARSILVRRRRCNSICGDIPKRVAYPLTHTLLLLTSFVRTRAVHVRPPRLRQIVRYNGCADDT
jgi:hypothetical protein